MQTTASCSGWKVRLSSCKLESIEEKLMNRTAKQRKLSQPTVRQLHPELQRLRRRVEDLEDLRDLNAAIERTGDKPGIP